MIDFYAAQKKNSQGIPGAPKLDPKRTVDGERHMTFVKPIPPTSEGKKFEIRSTVLGIYDKGKPGTVMETQNDLVDAETGELYNRAIGSAFFVGQGNWGGPKGPKAESFAPPEREPDAVVSTPKAARVYLLYQTTPRMLLMEADAHTFRLIARATYQC